MDMDKPGGALERQLALLDSDTCNELFLKGIREHCCKNAARAAPFTDRELIDRTLAREVRQNREVGPLLHWMDRDARTRLFLELYEEKGFPSVEKNLPFLETELLNRLAKLEFERNRLLHFDTLAPLLDQKLLQRLLGRVAERKGLIAIARYAPLLDPAFWETLRQAKERRTGNKSC